MGMMLMRSLMSRTVVVGGGGSCNDVAETVENSTRFPPHLSNLSSNDVGDGDCGGDDDDENPEGTEGDRMEMKMSPLDRSLGRETSYASCRCIKSNQTRYILLFELTTADRDSF
jgi:hypothetical protein